MNPQTNRNQLKQTWHISPQAGLFPRPNGVNLSSFPEGLIETQFTGTATYALFNFSSDFGRYIIDDVEGNFGTTEAVPEPMTLAGLGLAGVGLAYVRRRRRQNT